ncbi:Monophenol monooxygenase (Tyrosinase), partial [Pyrenophora tritici-repentis]
DVLGHQANQIQVAQGISRNTHNGGNKTETTTDAHSRTWKCLTDGPFKDIRPAYIMTEYAPHCLSRDFFDGDTRCNGLEPGCYGDPRWNPRSLLGTLDASRSYANNKPNAPAYFAQPLTSAREVLLGNRVL